MNKETPTPEATISALPKVIAGDVPAEIRDKAPRGGAMQRRRNVLATNTKKSETRSRRRETSVNVLLTARRTRVVDGVRAPQERINSNEYAKRIQRMKMERRGGRNARSTASVVRFEAIRPYVDLIHHNRTNALLKILKTKNLTRIRAYGRRILDERRETPRSAIVSSFRVSNAIPLDATLRFFPNRIR